jgi:hypothetical protein
MLLRDFGPYALDGTLILLERLNYRMVDCNDGKNNICADSYGYRNSEIKVSYLADLGINWRIILKWMSGARE